MAHIPRKIKFCKIDELKESAPITKWVDEWKDEISAFLVEGEILVLSSICPHFGGEFERVAGTRELRCKWPGWKFNLDSGECLTFKIPGGLNHYPFSEIDGYLELTLPDEFVA